MNPLFSFKSGTTPLLVSIPHSGTYVPRDISERLTPAACGLPDTDWYVDRLYQWVSAMGAGLLIANYSRYVVDLNRPPDDASLYATTTTGLLPGETFSGQPVYREGTEPGDDEARHRVQQFWNPYHEKITSELRRLKAKFGHAILFDAHSIVGELPLLFSGNLPDLNLGSNRGGSADPDLAEKCMEILASDADFSSVCDGRFQGGYITRNYGRPDHGVHALQLEMAQRVYMVESPPAFDERRAQRILPLLQALITVLIEWFPSNA